MLSSIHPLGERSKGNRFPVTATSFVVGAALGGLAVGVVAASAGALVAAVAGSLDPRVALTMLAIVAVLAAAAEATGRRVPGGLRRQVDEDWLQRYRGWVYGAGFGAQLGGGVFTHVTSAAVHVTVVATVLTGAVVGGWAGVVLGASVMGLFGLSRGASILGVRGVSSPADLTAFHRWLHRWAPAVQRSAVVVLVSTGLAAAVTVAAGS